MILIYFHMMINLMFVRSIPLANNLLGYSQYVPQIFHNQRGSEYDRDTKGQYAVHTML